MNIFLENELKFHEDLGPGPKRFAAVEIEVSSINTSHINALKKVVGSWSGDIKEDGSISICEECEDENCTRYESVENGSISEPFEITTAPAKGRKFIKQIREICKVLKAGKAVVNNSCGLHVHVDARDLEAGDLQKVSLAWEAVEGQMFRRVAKNRATNSFCKKWNKKFTKIYKTKGSIQSFLALASEINDYGDRYRSLNYQALEDHGTLENRIHHGTIDAKKIIDWAMINVKLIDFAQSTPISKIYNKRLSLKSINRFRAS